MVEFSPILKKSKKSFVRIFRPGEYELLIDAIPKHENQTKFDTLLFTGMRYKEVQALFKNPKWFDGNTIHIISTKKKAKQLDRWVFLNREGKTAVRYFLRGKTNLPAYSTWNEDLKRWCTIAGISTEALSVKTTRKTWESWLISTHSDKVFNICLSQGHSELTSLRHYANLPFSKEEKEKIKKYTDGWEGAT